MAGLPPALAAGGCALGQGGCGMKGAAVLSWKEDPIAPTFLLLLEIEYWNSS